jgi:hypothetical protein
VLDSAAPPLPAERGYPVAKGSAHWNTETHTLIGLREEAGDYHAAFESYRAGQAVDRDAARDAMRRCLEKMAESRKKDQGTTVHATK